MSKLKLLHFADIQYNVRGKHLNRKVEYAAVNKQLIEAAKDVDICLIAGDVFEHWDSNNIEEQLFIDLIASMLKVNAKLQIHCIAGNHDLKQTNNTFDNGTGNKEVYTDTLKKLEAAIADSRFKVYSKSGIYDIGKASGCNNLQLAVWATNECYINGLWCPWSPEIIGDEFDVEAFCNKNFVIEMFHAALQEATNFDGNLVKGDIESRQGVKAFEGHYVALGDIHKYQTFDTKRGLACYPSSTAIRDFGEGDYYVDGVCTQTGNWGHGHVTLTIDTDTKQIEDFCFTRVEQLVHWHTLKVDNDFDFDAANVDAMLLQCPGKINRLRLVNNVTVKGLSDKVDAYIAALMNKHVIASFDYRYGADGIAELNTLNAEQSDDALTTQLHDKNFLMQIVKEHALNIVENTAGLQDDMKQTFQDKFVALFDEQLSKIDLSFKQTSYELVHLTANMFMILTDVDVDFGGLGSLVRIAANNGNGKTSLFRLLRWMLSGQIDAWQNAGASKQNNLMYFNDKLDDDTLHAELTFVEHVGPVSRHWTLTRELTRKWKRNAKDITNPYWQSCVSKVDETLTLVCNETGETLENAAAASKLYEVFGSIWELCRFISINQESLDNIIAMKSDELNDWLLDQLGIDVFKQLEQTWESVKSQLFANIAKPAKSIELLQADANDAASQIETLTCELGNDSKIQRHLQQQLGVTRKSIEDESLKYQQIDDCRDLEVIRKDVEILKAQRSEYEKTLSTTVGTVDEACVAKVTECQQNINNLNGMADVAASSKLTELHDVEQQIAACKLNISEMSAKQRQIAQDEFDKLKADAAVSDKQLQDAIAVYAKWSTDVCVQHNQTLQQKVAEIDAAMTEQNTKRAQFVEADNAIKVKASAIKQKIETVNATLQQIQSGKCGVCHSDLDAPTQSTLMYREQLQNELAQLQSTYASLGVEHKSLLEQIANFDTALSDLMNAKSQTLTQVIDLNDKAAITQIAATIDAETQGRLSHDIEACMRANDTLKNAIACFKPANHFDAALQQQIDALNAQVIELSAKAGVLQAEANDAKQQVLASLPQLQLELDDAKRALEAQKTSVQLYDKTMTQLHEIANKMLQLQHEWQAAQKNQELLKQNAEVQKRLDELHETEKTLNAQLFELQTTIAGKQQQIAQHRFKQQSCEEQIEASKTWTLHEFIADSYRKAISKKGIVQQVFAKIANALNADLNELLSKCNYRIFFDLNDDNTLKMLDLVGSQTVRSIKQTSGMQGTFAALGIIDLILKKRHNCVGNVLMIDEVSGKLSNGAFANDINNINYQEVFANFLQHLAESRHVLIVDHVIESDCFDDTLQIQLQLNGTSKVLH